ncbi:MAG: hypothetical protein NT019_01030 [Candidatus Adlerbacteria bacterium]|nr:hypothetical protein [Candidatus Adlerbacteria bacterium]
MSSFNDRASALKGCVEEIKKYGAGTVSDFLKLDVRQALLGELSQHAMVRQPAEWGPHKVKQALKMVGLLPEGSLFLQVRDELALWLNNEFSTKFPNHLSLPLCFTEMSVQAYDPGPIGVEPHYDGVSVINLIALLVLEGNGQFCTCEDRAGTITHPIRNEPGDLLLMRGPGFLGSPQQVLHRINNITVKRTVVVCRHDVPVS